MPIEGERAFGCLFCATGKEWAVAERVSASNLVLRAVTARQEKYKSNNGKKFRMESVIFPGYVFFEAANGAQPLRGLRQIEGVIRVLTVDGSQWKLTGNDAAFAQYLFEYDGLLGFSKAYQDGDKIRIISGPLKDMEGLIRRIDKRGRSGQVVLNFNGRQVPVWLGFDLITDRA